MTDLIAGNPRTAQLATILAADSWASIDTSWCTTVKNRGIRVAVLYTEYLPLPTNAWYNTYVAPWQSQISGNMKNCATPGLFSQVTTTRYSAAMAALFERPCRRRA